MGRPYIHMYTLIHNLLHVHDFQMYSVISCFSPEVEHCPNPI